jgi:hypothetical protein
MKPDDPRKLRHEQQQQAEQEQVQRQATAGREFATPEELLRFDAARVQPPPAVAERLNRSLQREPKKPQSWWKKWFS